MNIRKTKKFNNKFRCKKYLSYRRARIYTIGHMNIDTTNSQFDIVYIIDSKRMDLKHPIKISILTKCIPVDISK